MSTRTTLTLDDDVALRLADEARRTGSPLRAVVNAALRRGLDHAGSPVKPEPFFLDASDMGLRSGFELDDIEALLDRLDGPRIR